MQNGRPKERPSRVANVHIMRTGGTYVNACLARALSPGWIVRNSWFAGLERDWTKEEMMGFLSEKGPVFVHNHVVSWEEDCVMAYKTAGFFLFTFVRDVGDQLTSLYFFMQGRRGIPASLSLDEFIRIQLAGGLISDIDHRHWEIPLYWPLIDFIAVFNQVNFERFSRGALGLEGDSSIFATTGRNASSNPGYSHLCVQGRIQTVTQRLVAESEFQRRFVAVRDLVFGDSMNVMPS